MEIKKHPKSNLENYTKLFVQLGLVLALFFVYVGIEHKTYDRVVDDLGLASLSGEEDEEMVITQRLEPVKPPPPPPPPAPEIIEIVEDEKEVEETVIESTETSEEEAVEVEEIIERGNKAEKKACFSKKISRHVIRKFDSSLAADLGLSSGKKRIYVMFKIDKTGAITEVRARAPHPRLQKEAERAVKTLPRMIPGKQRGRPVGVRYSLPIAFMVE